MTHEFRAPINAILSLSRLLLDGELDPERRTEVGFIRRAAETLSELVDDLLDMARIEAGKTTVRRDEFEVAELFAAARGLMRPLLAPGPVELIFEEPSGIPTLRTD
jgi:signal transduction histidine kinase